MNRRQRGVALISVLLVMSLALLLTGALLRSHRLALKSTAQQVHQVQVRQAGLAAERWALQRLRQAELRESHHVHLGQAWAQGPWPVEFDGATVHIDIQDLAGRFNLSLLVGGGQVDALTQQRWQRLLGQLHIDNPALENLVDAGFSGLSDLSQLGALPGVDSTLLQRLQSWVVVLPREASLNLNTASAAQLMTLAGINEATARTLVRQRPAQGYRSVQAFVEDPLLAGAQVGSHGLGLGSRWFRVTVDVELGPRRWRQVSEVELDDKTRQVHVRQRRFLNLLTSESTS